MPLRRSYQLDRLYFLTILISDFLIIGISIVLAVLIRFGSLDTPEAPSSAMMGTWVFLTLSQIVAMMVENLYVARTTVNRSMNIFRTIRMIVAISVVFIVVLFVTHFPSRVFLCSRLAVLTMIALWMGLTIISRLLLIPGIFASLVRPGASIGIVIFGEKGIAGRVRSSMLRSPSSRSVLKLKVCSDPLPRDPKERLSACMEVMESENAEELMMIFEDEDFDEIAEFCLLTRRRGIPFVIFSKRIPELGYFDPWLSMNGYGAMVFSSREWTGLSRRMWRAVDVAAASLGAILFLPVILVTIPAIALTSRGGVLYVQKRVGRGKETFDFLKFRSMRNEVRERQTEHRKYFRQYVNGSAASEDENGSVFKTISPMAVTPVGKVIRRTSIDELPQILNVIRGDMSIVGPRPCIGYELEFYDREWLQMRFTVKPGLTGIWQVYGRSRLSFEKSQFLDFVYVLSRADGLNMKLILKTFPVMVFGKGGL